MAGPAISWKTLDTGAWRSEIVEGGRYQLASPSTVTGNPSLAMRAGQSCTVRVYIGGTLYPDASLTINGTAPVAILNAIGKPLTGQEKFDLVIEVAMPYGQNLTATDEPNGSPAAPFTTTAERTAWATANLSSLRSGVSTVWGPGNMESVFVGPEADKWGPKNRQVKRNLAVSPLRELSYYGSANTLAGDRTISMQWAADGDFSGVRVEMTNYSAAPLTVGPVFVAAAANSADAGNTLTWVQVLFSGAATVTLAGATKTALGGGVAFDVAYTSAKSDIAYINSIPRADGSKYPILQTRVYYSAGGMPDVLDETMASYLTGMDTGKIYLAARGAGDLATSHAAVTMANDTANLAVSPAAVEFIYTNPIVSIANFGDSVQSGAAALDAHNFPPVGRAVKALNAALITPRYTYASYSQAAQKMVTTTANALVTIPISKPTIVRIPTFSPNDGAATAALLSKFWALTMQMVEAATNAGSLYYLVGVSPSWAGVNNASIQAYIAKCKAWCLANGVAYIDVFTLLGDPDSVGHFLPAYDSGDHVHPNGDGYNVIAAVDASVIKVLAN